VGTCYEHHKRNRSQKYWGYSLATLWTIRRRLVCNFPIHERCFKKDLPCNCVETAKGKCFRSWTQRIENPIGAIFWKRKQFWADFLKKPYPKRITNTDKFKGFLYPFGAQLLVYLKEKDLRFYQYLKMSNHIYSRWTEDKKDGGESRSHLKATPCDALDASRIKLQPTILPQKIYGEICLKVN